MCIFSFLNNKCIIKKFKGKKPLPYQRGTYFINGHYIIFFNFLFFGNVSWTTNMRPYDNWKIIIIYCMYIDFIQSFSSNHWININFDSKWTSNSKMLSCIFKIFLLVFRIIKKYHQDFSLLCTITMPKRVFHDLDIYD
jgi:hypothetical protein